MRLCYETESFIENNRIVLEERYNRAGRWSLRADDKGNECIKAWNADVITNTKVRAKLKATRERLDRLGC